MIAFKKIPALAASKEYKKFSGDSYSFGICSMQVNAVVSVLEVVSPSIEQGLVCRMVIFFFLLIIQNLL
jgi:hypothetical protein